MRNLARFLLVWIDLGLAAALISLLPETAVPSAIVASSKAVFRKPLAFHGNTGKYKASDWVEYQLGREVR